MTDHCRDTGVVGLEKGNLSRRYARNMGTFSIQDQAVLEGSRVCIVGLGGLGGAVTEILARLGIGALTLVDGDVFEESNLNRQLLCTMENLGTSKAGRPKPGRQINPLVRARIHDVFLDAGNAARLIEGADAAVDCLDSLKTRFVLEKAAKAAGIPWYPPPLPAYLRTAHHCFPARSGTCHDLRPGRPGAGQRRRSRPGHPSLHRHDHGVPGMLGNHQDPAQTGKSAAKQTAGCGSDGQCDGSA